jgi:hypothetical protein
VSEQWARRRLPLWYLVRPSLDHIVFLVEDLIAKHGTPEFGETLRIVAIDDELSEPTAHIPW